MRTLRDSLGVRYDFFTTFHDGLPMTALPKKTFSEAEYLALERAAEYRSEYYDGEIFARAGASYPHNRIKSNIEALVNAQLAGTSCFTMSSDMRVKIPRARAYVYPDIVIVCGEPEFEDESFDILLNPVAIIEVLSPSTENFDRRGKFRRYQRIPSLKEYVLVAQDEMLCERFVRGKDETWVLTTFDDPKEDFALGTLPVRFPLADIYKGVELPEPPIR